MSTVAKATAGYTAEQYKVILEEVASQACALRRLLMCDIELDILQSAALQMVSAIGVLADESTGANRCGGAVDWMLGSDLPQAGKAGAA